MSGEYWEIGEPKRENLGWFGKRTTVDPCNLFVPNGFRGFDKMVAANEAGKLKHYRLDPARGGIHVSMGEYIEVVGSPGRGRA